MGSLQNRLGLIKSSKNLLCTETIVEEFVIGGKSLFISMSNGNRNCDTDIFNSYCHDRMCFNDGIVFSLFFIHLLPHISSSFFIHLFHSIFLSFFFSFPPSISPPLSTTACGKRSLRIHWNERRRHSPISFIP